MSDPRFFVLSGPDLGRTYDLGEGAVFGRSPECEAPLRGGSISRKHARLERVGNAWAMVDLDSRNGLHHEGRRVKRVELENGTLFKLGDIELRFRVELAPSGSRVGLPAAPEESAGLKQPAALQGPAGLQEPAGLDEPAALNESAGEVAAKSPSFDPPVASTEIELEDIELEEIEFEPPAAPRDEPQAEPEPASVAPSVREKPQAASPAQRAALRAGVSVPGAKKAKPGELELQDGRPILQFNKLEARSGFALSDLGQQPAWAKLLVALVCVGLFVAIFYFAFRGTQYVREKAQGEPEMTTEGMVE